ncbi:unnamed protein product [Paramecium primaurelia]|uniref:MORN repeat protein n=1 Tax=Paramecium primaurelia TaxID=5886 RepID=A0A8S1Q546_PARPR|nr:unnamed protein product [Paramecium primaurelia]
MGNWMEKSYNFSDSSQVIYKGEYQYGKKIGRWDIQCRKKIDQPFKIIGGGLYNEKGDVKIGYWEEISDKFRDFSQIIYKGDYINGQKIGRWNIEYRKDFDEPFKKMQLK